MKSCTRQVIGGIAHPRTLTRRWAGMSGRSAHPSGPLRLCRRTPAWSRIDTGNQRPPWGTGRMFTLLTNGDRSRLDDLNDVLRIARPDDPGLCGHPPLDARRRPALGHDSRMAAAQPSAAQRVTVDEDQTATSDCANARQSGDDIPDGYYDLVSDGPDRPRPGRRSPYAPSGSAGRRPGPGRVLSGTRCGSRVGISGS